MKKLDNQGFSLVELMLAMAMMALVAVGALTIFGSATRSYQYSDNELNLQTEAQVLVNQIEERALTANNVSYDQIASSNDYLLTLYHIQYINKNCSAITQEEIFWIHKGNGSKANTVFLFSKSLSSPTKNSLGIAEAGLATTAAIKTTTFVKPIVEAANDEMKDLRDDVLAEINTAYDFSSDAELAGMDDLYKKHMLCRGIEDFSCNGTTYTLGGFDKNTDLSIEVKFKNPNYSREYTVSDVAHLRSKLRKIPK